MASTATCSASIEMRRLLTLEEGARLLETCDRGRRDVLEIEDRAITVGIDEASVAIVLTGVPLSKADIRIFLHGVLASLPGDTCPTGRVEFRRDDCVWSAAIDGGLGPLTMVEASA